MKKVMVMMIAFSLCVIFSHNNRSYAQAPTVFKPGDKISFTVKFEEIGKDQISSVVLNSQIDGNPANDQSGFGTAFSINNPRKLSTDTFEVSVVIPGNIASGRYMITFIDVNMASGAYYRFDAPAPSLRFDIKNDAILTKPKLKGLTLDSK